MNAIESSLVSGAHWSSRHPCHGRRCAQRGKCFMREFLANNLVHVVAFATLISRLGDIGTTFLVTPTLKVEANPVVRRFGWRYALATAAVALIPYYSIHGGVIILTVSFLIAASNASEAMLARFMGEEKYARLNRDAMQKMSIPGGLLLLCLPAFFYLMLGLIMSLLFPVSIENWGFDIAMGTVMCSVALLIFCPIRFFSERRLPKGPQGTKENSN